MTLSELLNKHYDKLNSNDLYIGQYINAHKKECVGLSIDELAARCNVSRTTVLRFAKKLSLHGYSELKVYLRMETERSGARHQDILEDACSLYDHAIDEFKTRDCTDICKLIYNAKRVIVYGTGYMQTCVATDMKRKFLNVGKLFLTLEGARETERVVKILEPDDVVIIISLSGENEVAVQFAKALKLRGIPVISLTKLKTNPLSHFSNTSIYVGTSEIQVEGHDTFETAMLFYMMTEILLLKYTIYKLQIESA